ncbi:hypothetical protein K435DRAFT_95149 [Dendrothele bispora CBS 962.96]|uniref:Uncharacterized protein n=1 Tax=Dendrothele bispora (strain CBS 962.96) TaxID=1314807 RepID=A0A4S8KP51_DENBC|nr:hypothetical protein K435DRAFT_95149 [Dendrothele bispora CBS 962.96]
MCGLSDAEVYSFLLLLLQHGYPLFKPNPYESLPEIYRLTGIRLGDVGRITQDGHFHFFFNALAPKNDPVNEGGVPANFEPLEFDMNKVLKCGNYHKPGDPIYSIGTKQYALGADVSTQLAGIPAEGSGGIELKFEENRGALLLLPNGATRVDVETIIPFRQYAYQHCEEWYRFAENRGIEVENGSLYFVTGFDKTNSWENAAFSNPTRDASVSLRLASGVGPGGRLQLSQSSNLVTPSVRGSSPAGCGMNQSVFIRGFKITLSSTAWFRYKSPIKMMDLSSGALKGLKPKNIVARGTPVSFNERPGRAAFLRPQPPPPPPSPAPPNNFNGSSGPGSLSPQWSSTNTRQNVSRCSEYEVGLYSDSDLESGLGSDSNSGSDSDFQGYDSESDSDSEDFMMEGSTRLYHPSNVLNDHLLATFVCHSHPVNLALFMSFFPAGLSCRYHSRQ